MKYIIKVFLSAVAVVALAGCAHHTHHISVPKHTISSAQANQNAIKNGLYGGPLKSHAPSLAAYSLKGYGTPSKE